MSAKKQKLNADGCVDLASKMAQDYLYYSVSETKLPNKLTYKVAFREESLEVERNARKAALIEMANKPNPLVKFAFDTRRFDQETTRNPRANLQNWVRSEQFVDDETQTKITIFSKLLKPLEHLKKSFGDQPEWHNSYTRILYESIYRILRVKEADRDIFRPQLAYLEQLMFSRYRLSMEELSRISNTDFQNIVLRKDENLLKRGIYLKETEVESEKTKQPLSKDGDVNTQQGIINAIFGNTEFRRPGERTATRTITITIKDSAENIDQIEESAREELIDKIQVPKKNYVAPLLQAPTPLQEPINLYETPVGAKLERPNIMGGRY